MSTGDTEEVPPSERQLVVFDPQAHKPICWPNNWVSRCWRFGDSFPTYPAADLYPEDLRGNATFGLWRGILSNNKAKSQFEVLDNILRIRKTLFHHFPKSQSWDSISQLIIGTLHGEKACTPKLCTPIKAVTDITSRKVNFFKTRDFIHRYIPAFEFTASYQEQRKLCQESLQALKGKRKYSWDYQGPSDSGKRRRLSTPDNFTYNWDKLLKREIRSLNWYRIRHSQLHPHQVFVTHTGEVKSCYKY